MYTDATPLFATPPFRAYELHPGDAPALQAFFEANPEYFFSVEGQPPAGNAAHEEIHGELPAGWPFTKKWLIAFTTETGAMVAMANVVSDLLAPKVWHIGLFIVAAALQGSGAAQSLYRALEQWMERQGARWLRLGVVEGNGRGERFWIRAGYIELRKRGGIEMGQRVNTVRVMAKPLGVATLSEYLALVERDRPDV